MRQREGNETTMLALIEEGDVQEATSRLLVIVTQLQVAVKSLISINKSTKIESKAFKTLWEGEKEKNGELITVWKKAIVVFQER